jgi:ribonuclease HI
VDRNVSARLRGAPQTNQRAELAAIQRALQIAGKSQALRIFSDSKYSINCVTDWYKNWIKNDWKTSAGAVVQNQDLIKGIRDLIDARDQAGTQTLWQWVQGHADDPGNLAADRLAVAGAKLPEPE